MPESTLTTAPRQNWLISTRGASAKLYALAIVNTKFRGLAQKSTLSGAVAQSGPIGDEFVFNMNPKSLDLEEPGSTVITPTQDGSNFVESQGSLYKNIAIGGTTGLRPNKADVKIIPVLGIPNPLSNPDVSPETLLPAKERTGMDELLSLRNLFRRYWDLKRDPAHAHETMMVWQNGKEGEFYIVEPINIRTRRDSGSPLTWAYEISLRTLKRVEFEFVRPNDPYKERNSRTRLSERLTDITRKLSSALAIAQALTDRTVGVAQATLNEVIGPARAVLDGVTGITTSATRAFSIPRNSLALLSRSAIDLSDALEAANSANNAYKEEGVLTQLAEVQKAFKSIAKQASRLFAEDSLFAQPISSKFKARSDAYIDPDTGRKPPRSSSPTNIANAPVGSGTALGTVLGRDNIFSVAQRLLGDSARWKELVVTNDLKPPYVDPTGDGVKVKRPGDKILYPTSGSSSPSAVTPDTNAVPDPIVGRLGRDLQLVSFSAAGGLVLLDLAKNINGDLERIEGIDNLEQAIELKFSTEQGSLPTHPDYGLAAPIGSKALIRTFIGFHLNLRSSLLADPRISSVNSLSFQLDGNTVSVNADLNVAEIDQGVSISFDARR
jgi:hypothetical protein